jgi:hypothetical protein
MHINASQCHTIIDIIRRKVPVSMLFIHLVIGNTFYSECKNNTFNILNIWLYLSILGAMCFIWKTVYAIAYLLHAYSHKSKSSIICFGLCSALISLWIFVTTSYYVEGIRMTDCAFQYDQTVGPILFLTAFLLTILFSLFEHYKWGVVQPMYCLDTNHDNQSVYYSQAVNPLYGSGF